MKRIRKAYSGVVPSGKVLNTKSDSNIDTYSSKYINEEICSKPVVLWENPSPASSFNAQVIELKENLTNFSYYQVLCCQDTTTPTRLISSGIIPVDGSCIIQIASDFNYFRSFDNTNGYMGNCVKFTSYGGATTNDNTKLVPVKIIGYK